MNFPPPSASSRTRNKDVRIFEPTIARPNLRTRSQKAKLGSARKSGNAGKHGSSGESIPIIAGRIEKTPSPKKRNDKVRPGRRSAAIRSPLSQLARQFPSIEIPDIDSFVKRSFEERHAEINLGKNPGKVKRPMNAFMLYRKAHQMLAKTICCQKNHQYVSQICGDSWAIEPMAIREKFNVWAKIERINHQTAHPEYRFSPNKVEEKVPVGGDETEVEDADAEDDLSITFDAVRLGSPHLGQGDIEMHEASYGASPSEFQVAPAPAGAVPTQDTSSSFGNGPVSSPATAPSPTLAARAESPLFTTSTESQLANTSPQAVTGTQQIEPNIPVAAGTYFPPFPNTENFFNAEAYPHPVAMEFGVPFFGFEEEANHMLETFENEHNAHQVVNDVPVGQGPMNPGENWAYFPPTPNFFSTVAGL
ncbi:Transcription factor ste11 [Ceratocystis platani]|uniref:Transcription factor ste11 n=1 Tax=Ceratocystis fimbriata f. sp. platani TaxID=88771 RepID=A0A0F8DK73_CERFI|nr:Transcription factor ste11 [Ceratocystis platani]